MTLIFWEGPKVRDCSQGMPQYSDESAECMKFICQIKIIPLVPDAHYGERHDKPFSLQIQRLEVDLKLNCRFFSIQGTNGLKVVDLHNDATFHNTVSGNCHCCWALPAAAQFKRCPQKIAFLTIEKNL